MGLDATQLSLIGQAYLRCSSPTDELMHRLDSANVRITEFCFYLERMNHCRALEMLKPYRSDCRTSGSNYSSTAAMTSATTSDESGVRISQPLATPTPSFSERTPALMMDSNADLFRLVTDNNGGQQLWTIQTQTDQNLFQLNLNPNQAPPPPQQHQQQQQPPTRCHKQQQQQHLALSTGEAPTQPMERRQPAKVDDLPANRQPDPGEEIVRMACANNRKRTSISDQEVVNQLRLIMQITYNELKLASNDFSDSNILGNGGFASVYRGNWKGTDVAIKRLKCNLMDQALNELTILNSYRIDNILPIYGISIDGPEACLVYQFMSNGSLEDRLSCKKGTRPLTWTQRALIGEGVAKGLFYLHTLRDKPLVHGDVKSANVLLDSQFVPKLGDFGLARQVFRGKNPQTEPCTSCTVSSIHGTSVYLPPEYLRHKILSPAVDVYSYGIVLLEMATGKRAYDGKRLLIDLVQDEQPSMAKGEISYSLKDPKLADDTQSDLKIWFELLIKLGLVCAHKIKRKRPDMGHILNRFIEFRTGSESADFDSQGQMLSQPHQTNFTLGSLRAPSTVVGSTKPSRVDTSALHQQQYLQQQQINQQQQFLHQQAIDAIQIDKAPIINNALFNSNLMSVEEEQAPLQPGVCVNNQQIHQMQPVNQEIDAVIPLLTELGMETKT